MKYMHSNAPVLSVIILILGSVTWGNSVPVALANNFGSACYVEDENGELYDLSILCTVPDDGFGEPVLQTGDIQVTLRWNTSDDLDLIVVDPAGSIIDFGSPSSPSGGQLDVDANGFCETQNFSPVENIFWPTGGAPDGDYLAYVTLSIPCSLEDLANSNAAAAAVAYEGLEVPYTLTILNQGITTTHEGISRPEQFGVDYPFQVGETGKTAEPALEPEPELPEDDLELPKFDTPQDLGEP
ncbi:MAG: hypothetical protein F6K11_22140 [Leptolyngbya sp. SIO3F4]|nr:hypothetical protein [Leptolyngbya sp. SIO3F4]